jgi:hypothetical protein
LRAGLPAGFAGAMLLPKLAGWFQPTLCSGDDQVGRELLPIFWEPGT